MSRKVDSVKDINDSKETWRLAVRIMDVWSVVNNKGIEHLKMIVMDSLGDRIQVLIRHDHLLKWKEAIELQNIPPKGYFFKDFGEILQGKCKTDRLEDIIGAVSEINHIQSNTPGKKVVVSVVLKDLKGNCINCNLWEIYGSKFLAYYNDPKNNGAIIILLTHAMVKDGQVSNAWSGSKLLINEDIPEIQDFMSKLPTNEQKEKPTQSAKSLSNWSGGSQYSPVERFVHNTKCMSLSQFCKIKHETLCVTVATTLKFAVSKYGWFYYDCTRCSSKAPNPEKAYECSCGQKVEQPIPRYKIGIYVSNGESKYRFVFWDSECAAILGMTAEFMHNSMVENGEDDPMVYPDELEMLLNKKMAFRVKVQPTFSQASVWKLCDDEAFVKEIENDYIVEDNQSKTEYAKLVRNKENLETFAYETLAAKKKTWSDEDDNNWSNEEEDTYLLSSLFIFILRWFKGFRVPKVKSLWYHDAMDINELVLLKDDACINKMKLIALINGNVHLYVMHPIYGEEPIPSLENNVGPNDVEEDNLEDLNNGVKSNFEDLGTLKSLEDDTLDDLNNDVKGTFDDLGPFEELNNLGDKFDEG
ncbi:hypothetical protein KIW84_072760 [Lathyrus oleraceus]|uniref:Replication protein A 70 kDa DNA-binding subunit B/D first OB fold domain-containing protein n=1 Tax=Pisum sativum TaxID=3888 RepID=A0A9D4VLV7_PEA|nr:hypothetical protein KIW84_072760 [Pisum sativum]